MVARDDRVLGHLYGWAEAHPHATPFVADPAKRSLVVGTIDFDDARRRRGARGDAARQRDRRRRAVPQARPQPAAGRDVPGDRSGRRAGADRVHRLGAGAAVSASRDLHAASGRPRVLVAEKIGDSGHRAAAGALRRRPRGRLEPRGARRADRRLRRDPDPLGDEARRGADRQGARGCARSAAPASASTTSTSPPRPSAGSSSPTRRSPT